MALLPALTSSSLLRPSATTNDSLLLPLLQRLAASGSWAVRKSTAEVLPLMLAAVVERGVVDGATGSQGEERGGVTSEEAGSEGKGVRVPAQVVAAARELLERMRAKKCVAGGQQSEQQQQQQQQAEFDKCQQQQHKNQEQQQQPDALQRTCEAIIRLLVTQLGTQDVSHWVRSAAVSAAGPALCALPRCVCHNVHA